MAQNKLIDLALLTTYDEKIKALMASEDAKSIKSLSFNSSTRVVSFFKTEDGSGTAAYTVTLPDTSNFIEKVANATAGDFVTLAADGTLVDAGSTIAAQKITIVDADGHFTSTDVEGALAELAEASSGGVASKTIWLNPNETVTAGYLKTYGLYQGENSYDAQTNPATLIGKIDIPKDLVVTAGKVVTVTNGVDSDGETTSVADGTYVKLTIANQTEKIYINVADLCDVYTAQASAAQVQLAISATNVISATIVAGSIGTTELANSAVTTAKIADSNVTTAKIADENVTKGKLSTAVQASLDLADSAVQSVVEGSANGTISVDGTNVAVHGLGSAAYANTTAFDAAGTAASLIGTLDSTTASATNTADSGLVVLTEVAIADGLISTKKSKTLGSAANYADTDFLKTADYTLASTADINALFERS